MMLLIRDVIDDIIVPTIDEFLSVLLFVMILWCHGNSCFPQC